MFGVIVATDFDCCMSIIRSMKNNPRSLLLLIHYWFPVVMGWSIVKVIEQATGWSILPDGLRLYLLCIFAAYSLDRLLDYDDSSRPRWRTIALSLGFIVSAAIGLFLALKTSFATISILVIFALLTLLYSRLKKFPFIKFLLVAIVWTWAGVALPFANPHWFAWQFWTTQVSIPLVMLIAGNCILCDFKDVQSDSAANVHSLPVMFGIRNTMILTAFILIVAGIISFYEHRLGLVISSIALLALTQFPQVLALEAVGPLVVDATLVIPGLLIVLHMI